MTPTNWPICLSGWRGLSHDSGRSSRTIDQARRSRPDRAGRAGRGRTNRVVALAFVLAGGLAATVTLVLAVQRPLATPTFGFMIVIPALVGVVVGGMNRLVTATFGGFVIGMATGLLGNLLPSGSRVFLNSALFALVIIVLLVKPNGLFVPGRAPAGERL